MLAASAAVVAAAVVQVPERAARPQPFTAAPAVLEPTTPAPAARPSTARPSTVRPPSARRRTAPPVEAALGPPPGPQVDARPARTAAPTDRYALVIGVTAYRAPTHRTIAGAQDARLVASMLLQAGWLPGNIRVLTDEQATGQAVRAGLAWIAARGVTGTFSYVHFSGHVKQAGGHEKLWPVDRDFVPDTEVAAQLHRVAGHLWLDVAGCEAAGFIEDLPSDRVLVSTSSRATQKSYEYPEWGESVWTGLVYDLGTRQGDADADHDGSTTVGEALRYATYYAQSVTLTQRPYGRQTPQVAGDPVRGWTLADPPA